MKKRYLVFTLSMLMSMALVSCNKSDNEESSVNSSDNSLGTSEVINDIKVNKGDQIFENRIIYDTSKEAYDVHVKFNATKKITQLVSGRAKASEGEFTYENGILSISKNFMKNIGSGEKTITVTYEDNKKDSIDAFIATKVITTAKEFQDINENLTGAYILGNDIDLSTIANFEPLGKYYTETDTRNDYFHGILDGNGYSVKNAKVYYCSSTTTSEEVYNHNSLFEEECHKNGDNVGLFQIIGSSGIVKNLCFDNIKVRGRTIVGIIAGNCSGTIENCIVKDNCSVQMGTHFYDNDCNMGAVAGIVAGSGIINNVISLTKDLFVPNEFIDYSDDYKGKIGNGWDHVADPNNVDPTWKFANVDRDLQDYSLDAPAATSSKELDSNNSQTNGVYSFAGKTWGVINDSYALAFKQTPYQGSERDVYFTQTHLAKNKPGSGNTDLGMVTNCATHSLEELKSSTLYSSYDTSVWNIKENTLPSLNCPLYPFTIAE